MPRRGYLVSGPASATYYLKIAAHRPDTLNLVVHNIAQHQARCGEDPTRSGSPTIVAKQVEIRREPDQNSGDRLRPRVVGRAKWAAYTLAHSYLPIRTKLELQTFAPSPNVGGTGEVLPRIYNTKECNRQKLRAVQNTTLLCVVGSPRRVINATIARDLRIECIDKFVTRLAKGMFDRGESSVAPRFSQVARCSPHKSPPPHRPVLAEREPAHHPKGAYAPNEFKHPPREGGYSKIIEEYSGGGATADNPV
ncbi:unnamed protein product [Pieris macdunnoughi]|uniref:Uncharacterized protein n=1 Tax=Pieris macdunnoughi TaxID=345717 RepID=A0A821PVZ1_9NEOP|nr:unnamed protein product [Pieris macdunnoughi]